MLETNTIPVITGFIGSTRDNITTTLGRNGSDYSASILGSLLKVNEIVIYTDVPGVFSTDPRLISTAEQVTDLSYEEAFEMSYYGAKVLHPKTILPAAESHIPIRIKNTFDSENLGTLIKSESKLNGIKVINLIPNISIVNVLGKGMIGVPGISARTFNCARNVGANILMISQSAAEQKIGFVLRSEDVIRVINELNQEFESESERKDISMITQIEGSILCCVGQGISENPLILRQIFEVFEENNIKTLMMVLGASEINLSMVLRKEDAERGLKVLHKRIIES
jgi:aspartate kinase